MPDTPSGTRPFEPQPRYLTPKDAAALTGRNLNWLYRMVREGHIPSIPDPETKRSRLIPDTAIVDILRMRGEGTTWTQLDLTRESDGAVIAVVVRGAKRKARKSRAKGGGTTIAPNEPQEVAPDESTLTP